MSVEGPSDENARLTRVKEIMTQMLLTEDEMAALQSERDRVPKLTDAELVRLQLHRNDWHVRHARRLLHELLLPPVEGARRNAGRHYRAAPGVA